MLKATQDGTHINLSQKYSNFYVLTPVVCHLYLRYTKDIDAAINAIVNVKYNTTSLTLSQTYRLKDWFKSLSKNKNFNPNHAHALLNRLLENQRGNYASILEPIEKHKEGEQPNLSSMVWYHEIQAGWNYLDLAGKYHILTKSNYAPFSSYSQWSILRRVSPNFVNDLHEMVTTNIWETINSEIDRQLSVTRFIQMLYSLDSWLESEEDSARKNNKPFKHQKLKDDTLRLFLSPEFVHLIFTSIENVAKEKNPWNWKFKLQLPGCEEVVYFQIKNRGRYSFFNEHGTRVNSLLNELYANPYKYYVDTIIVAAKHPNVPEYRRNSFVGVLWELNYQGIQGLPYSWVEELYDMKPGELAMVLDHRKKIQEGLENLQNN